MRRLRSPILLAAFVGAVILALATGDGQRPASAADPKKPAFKTGVKKTAPKQAPRPAAAGDSAACAVPAAGTAATSPSKASKSPKPTGKYEPVRTPRKLSVLRGEIVDFYCYIEKSATGPNHRECAVKCVAGDICMGLLTPTGDLFMISQDHMRAMQPLEFAGIQNPFDKCRGWIAGIVDLKGFILERGGQRLIEIQDVSLIKAPPPYDPKLAVPTKRGGPDRIPRKFAVLRGEIVDFYCYIDKGLTGPDHRECAVKCVAGDICMGLLTATGDLFMISQDHMRAMQPLEYVGMQNPFDKCRGWIAGIVDVKGYVLERRGQRLIEIQDVSLVKAPELPDSRQSRAR